MFIVRAVPESAENGGVGLSFNLDSVVFNVDTGLIGGVGGTVTGQLQNGAV